MLLGEGALWDDEKQVLYSIDIVGGKIFVYDPIQQKNIHVIDLRMHIGACVRRAKPGVWHLVCGTSRGFCIVDVTTGKIVEWLEDPEAGIRTNRMNDGKCDPQGRFWCGSMGLKCETGFGSLYCLGTDLKVTRALTNATIPNGITWSQDGNTMFWTDTGDNSIYAFDFDQKTGCITNRRVALKLPSSSKEKDFVGYIDGTTMDSSGRLWAAMWGGSGVRCFDLKTGKCESFISVPAEQVTSCTFGGRNLTTLYITSASCGIGAVGRSATPLAGHVFEIDLAHCGVKGLPASTFRG